MIVYVVSFAPADEHKASTGGFEWRYALEDAEQEYAEQVAHSQQYDGSHIVRLVEVAVPEAIAGHYLSSFPQELSDAITRHLDADIDALEITAPALRQFVPEVDEANRIPTGGTT